jgi:ABC-2 type transport system ATP-binding protein
MNVVEFNKVMKAYGKKNALNSLTFALAENKITGLIGRNGAGKTTMLKIAAGFIRETSGEVRVFQEHPFNNLKASANTIFIDQDLSLPGALTLDEILSSAAEFYQNWDMKLARGLFTYFAFNPNQTHVSLSKGMQSTFNAILGLAARCPLTIFDEPTTGMDAGIRNDFYRALLKDYIAHPRTVIISSHHLSEVEDILEDILLLKDGAMFIHMPVDELKDFGIGVSGKEEVMIKWLDDHEIFHKSNAPFGGVYAVVRNDISPQQKQMAREIGLEFSSVSSEDLCSYLTNEKKGGIDDVFDRS